jgi:hypothetical protein
MPADAQNALDAGGLTFKDFAVADHGSSFSRSDSTVAATPGQAAQLIEIDNAKEMARVHFKSIKAEASVPLGWQAKDDGERGLAFNANQSYRLILSRVDFVFEGVRDVEHYASTKAGTIESRRPGVKAQARRLPDGSFLVAYENVPPGQGDQGARTVFDIVMANPSDAKTGFLITLGMPAAQEERGLHLAALIKETLRISW